MRRFAIVIAAVLSLGIIVLPPQASANAWTPGEELYDVAVTKNVPVTMPDGRVLRVAVSTPTLKGTTTPAPGKFPVILVQTPYGKSVGNTGLGALPPYLLKRGYLGVNVDVAGTGGSQGQSMLFGQQEAKDGAELVRWAAALPKSNGKVGMVGGSYLGIDQMFTAAEVGPGVTAQGDLPDRDGN